MTQHYSRNTVEVSAWCKRCARMTMHRVYDVKLGPCLVCQARLDEEHESRAKAEPTPQQMEMFKA